MTWRVNLRAQWRCAVAMVANFLKDAKLLLVCNFGLLGAKRSVISIEKRFNLRRGSFQRTRHALIKAGVHIKAVFWLVIIVLTQI